MRKIAFCALVFSFVLLMMGCGSSTNTDGVLNPDKIVPKYQTESKTKKRAKPIWPHPFDFFKITDRCSAFLR